MKNNLIFIGLLMFPVLSFAQCDYSYGKWDTTLTSMPSLRYSFSSLTYNDSIYIVGGFVVPNGSNSEYESSVDLYIPETDTWERGITELPFPRGGSDACLIDGKIFVLGGVHFTDEGPIMYDSVHVYDIRSNSWKVGHPFPTKLGSFSADTLNGKIYVAGGGTDGWEIVNSLYEYDPDLDEWTEKAPMTRSRRGHCLRSWGGRLYAFGGYSQSDYWTVSKTFEMYDPEKNEWTRLSDADIPRAGMGMSLYGDQFLVFGGIHGYSDTEYYYTEKIYRYDLTTDSWFDFFSKGDNFPGDRQLPATAFVNDRVYVFGGYLDNLAQDNVWSYSVKNIRQNIEIRDTLLTSDSIYIDLADYFSSSGEEELSYSICQGYDEATISASIENSIVKIKRLSQESKSTEIAVNAFDSQDTISSNSFILDFPVEVPVHYENTLSVYPNPASSLVLIKCSTSFAGVANLKIYNSLGEEIKQFTWEPIKANDPGFEFNVEDFPAGFYLAVLKSGMSVYTCKLIIQK